MVDYKQHITGCMVKYSFIQYMDLEYLLLTTAGGTVALADFMLSLAMLCLGKDFRQRYAAM